MSYEAFLFTSLANMYYMLACLCCTLLCLFIFSWLHGRRARAYLAGLPSFPALPVLGNVLKLLGGGENIYRIIVDVSNKAEEHQKPVVLWIGPLPAIPIDPEDVKSVTNAFIEKPFFYNFGRIYVGEGLVTASGATWKRNVKKLAGTFIGPVVDGYQDVYNTQAQKLVDNLKREVGGAPFDILQKYLALATLESICQTALGFPSISKNVVTAEYYAAFTRTMELLIQRGVNPLLYPDWLYEMTPAYREIVKCVGKLHDVSKTIVVKRKREFIEKRQNGTFEEHEPKNGGKKFCSFLDMLLELGDTDPLMTEEQIQAEVDTIIVGGQETTATTLMYIFLAIGSISRVQDKMCAELKSIFGDSKRPVEKEDLVRMTYCEAIIYESLRLFPPFPCVIRHASHDLKLSKRYAMAILKTVLAYCLREFVFVSDTDQLKFKVDIDLKPISGHYIQVRQRM